ncbi:MAG: transporter substrate-binding domain-containing protein [Pseudomonadota bacterium]
MKTLIALAVCVLVFAANASAAEKRLLKIAATEYPPYYSEALEDGGFMTEIITKAFSREGYDLTVRFLPWKRALESTKRGEYDGLFTVWYRPEREEWFLFSEPLPANELGFFRQKDEAVSYEKLEDLKGKTIGVVRGYASPAGFEEAGLKTAQAKDDEQNLAKLLRGRVDLALIDRVVGTHIINTLLPEAKEELVWVEPPVAVDIQYLVISKEAEDHTDIMADFNKGLSAIEADGTLTAIMAKHGF